MKKRLKQILGVMLSTAVAMTPMMQAFASPNNYDAAVEDLAGKVLFPEDSVVGVAPIYMGPDGMALEGAEGGWSNDTVQAYAMSAFEGEGGGLWLEPKGYVLTVNGGTSKVTGVEDTEKKNHFKAKEETEEDRLFPKDVAYYEAWTDVTIMADPAPEGQMFAYWEIESENVSLTDAYAAETNFTMIEDEVILNAVYVEAPVETEAPTEALTEAPVYEEPQPMTEEIVYVEEQQPVTEEIVYIEETQPITEAPALYNLVVENGSGSGDYEVGSIVTVAADTVEGMVFAGWTTEAVTVWFEDAYSAQTSFSMPAESVSVKANFIPAETSAPETEIWEEEIISETEMIVLDDANTAAPEETITEAALPELYSVEVEYGEGGGYYEAGAEVVVYADAPGEGQDFAGWITSDNLSLTDPQNEEAIFVMPAGNVTLKATYMLAETEAPAEPETDEEIIYEEEIVEIEEEDAADGGEEEFAEETEEWYEDTTEVFAGEEDEEEESETDAVVEELETETEAQTELLAPADPQQVQLSSNEDITIVTADGNLQLDEYGIPVFNPGEKVTLKATEYADRVLDFWTLTKADGSQEAITPTMDLEDPYITSFTMPNVPVYVEVYYTVLNDNDVQVMNGSGSGTYQEGDYVEITANKAPAGYRFKEWVVLRGDIALDDPTAKTTGFEMPAEAVQIKAVYQVATYKLTVENGNGSGKYQKGETVKLSANYPASGKVFAGWKVTSEKGAVAAADRYYTSITMPAAKVTVAATYKDGPSPAYNEIQNIVAGGEYLKGQTITFTAVGNGMGNNNPNPGDYRYRPTGYQIGSVSGNWNNYPYTTSMAINAVGEYTLTVNYSKDVFDGNNWVADGTYDSKSVTFYVVNALSVQTGDTSPIIPLIIAAVSALLVIVVLMVVRVKRRRRY